MLLFLAKGGLEPAGVSQHHGGLHLPLGNRPIAPKETFLLAVTDKAKTVLLVAPCSTPSRRSWFARIDNARRPQTRLSPGGASCEGIAQLFASGLSQIRKIPDHLFVLRGQIRRFTGIGLQIEEAQFDPLP